MQILWIERLLQGNGERKENKSIENDEKKRKKDLKGGRKSEDMENQITEKNNDM